MLQMLEIIAVLLSSVAMALSLAHALELPGKMRLDRDTYIKTQGIYYPGFTIGGISEPLGVIAVLVLLFATPAGTTPFWLTLAAFVALLLAHACYWLLTHPVNKFWLEGRDLSRVGARFFGRGKGSHGAAPAWEDLRRRWEWSHVIRAAFAGLGFVLLVIVMSL